MTRAPDIIAIVRHGARLDAADASWHLTSPTPYDPPLTYGGWNQSKILGTRIGRILQKRKLGKNQKVIIHTSPFLRCLQTSIGISAGIAQSDPLLDRTNEEQDLPEPNAEEEHQRKPLLRVDPFLGEWLSPDYYEHITPPPDSTLMLLSAKAELLQEEQVEVFQESTGHFPGGWSRQGATEEIVHSSSPSIAQVFTRHRTSSQSRLESPSSSDLSSAIISSRGYYNPPIPTYAVAPPDPIPRGYVTHAREACLDVDLNWDSMREPPEWGDGGDYGEEWSALHRRFRRGLASMISWYRNHSPESHGNGEEKSPTAIGTEDDSYDLVLILVTHSAGCNALIGAITNQPVLIDVGQASLTLAVRKAESKESPKDSFRTETQQRSPSRRKLAADHGISEEYEIAITASSDHLRSSTIPTSLTSLLAPASTLTIRPSFRRQLLREPPITDENAGNTTVDQVGALRQYNSALESVRRTASVSSSSYISDSGSSSRNTSRLYSGLWNAGPRTSEHSDGVSESSVGSETNHQVTTQPSLVGEQDSEARNNRTTQTSGLWSPKFSAAKNARDLGPKRRWTMNESDA